MHWKSVGINLNPDENVSQVDITNSATERLNGRLSERALARPVSITLQSAVNCGFATRRLQGGVANVRNPLGIRIGEVRTSDFDLVGR